MCATSYVAAAKVLVRRLKFDRAKAAARDMARIMSERLPCLDGQTVITYIPTAPERVRQRGYDQARVLARYLGRYTGYVVTPLLHRETNSRQVGQDRLTRQKQARKLFTPKPISMPKHVLLVDDVLTTGATLQAASNVLHGAGVKHITAVVFAAAERFG